MSAPHPMTYINDLLVMTSGLHWKPWAWFLLLQQSEFLPQIRAGALRLLPPALYPIVCLLQYWRVEALPDPVSSQ